MENFSGQQMDETCQDLNSTTKIDCETRHIAGDIKLSLQNENLSSNQTNCGESFVERSINTFCGTFNNSEKCEFKVFDFPNKTEECSVLYKNVYVTYQCFGKYVFLIISCTHCRKVHKHLVKCLYFK